MSSIAEPETEAKAEFRQWFGLAMLLLPTMLMTADLGVLWLATPDLVADLQPTSAQLLWITDSYGFLTAGFLVIMGTLGDRIGRRKLLMIGSLLFIAASLLAAYATSPDMLIVGRGLLGIAGAAVLPSTLALISTMFGNARQRATAIAMWVTALSVGLGIGPVIGGVLLLEFWWGSVFLIGLPIMVLALATAPILFPEYRDPGAGRPDLPSVALFLLGILPIVYVVKAVAEHGFGTGTMLALLVGVTAGVAFARRQYALDDPMIDIRLFGNRQFSAALATLLLGMMALNGVEYIVPQFLQLVGETSPLAAALWLLPGAAGLLVGSQLTPILTRVLRPAYVIAGGQLVALIGFATTFLAADGQSGVVLAALGLTLIMFGVAPISVLCTGIAVSSAPPQQAGAAAGAGQTSYDLGLALGIAVVGSASVALYRSQVAANLPSNTPAGVDAAAQDTLGSAIAAAHTLPQPLSGQLTAVARDAFISGFHGAAVFGAALAAVVAVLALTLLRDIPATPKTRADASDDAVAARP